MSTTPTRIRVICRPQCPRPGSWPERAIRLPWEPAWNPLQKVVVRRPPACRDASISRPLWMCSPGTPRLGALEAEPVESGPGSVESESRFRGIRKPNRRSRTRRRGSLPPRVGPVGSRVRRPEGRRGEPLDTRPGTVAPLGHVQQVELALVEGVAGVDEDHALETDRLRDRKRYSKVLAMNLLPPTTVRLVEVVEVVDVVVEDAVAGAVDVAAVERPERTSVFAETVRGIHAERRQDVAQGVPDRRHPPQDRPARPHRTLAKPRSWNCPRPPRK